MLCNMYLPFVFVFQTYVKVFCLYLSEYLVCDIVKILCFKVSPDLNNRFENSLDSLIYITYFFIEYIKHLKENTLDSF